MNGKAKRFPLPLSSVTETFSRATQTQSSSARHTATPQTATQNAARNDTRSNDSRSNSSVATVKPVASGAHTERTTPLVSDAVRKAMVARLVKQGIRDATVLAAMEAVPRHLFIESGLSSQAYIDASLPIGHHQTISQPYIVARMIEVMRANQSGGKLQRVLEIGTGCGYQAAVLARVAQDVYSIERIRALHELAKSNLRPLRIANLRLQYGDGMLGLPQVAPFDGIILAAAGLEVPATLLQQMTVGGRLVAPVGARHQVLQLIERLSASEWTRSTLEDCHFVPLRAGTL